MEESGVKGSDFGDLSSCVEEVFRVCFQGSLEELKRSVQKLLISDSPQLKEALENQNRKKKAGEFITSMELSALESIRDKKGHSVAHIAAAGGNLEILQTLLTASPKLAHLEDENGENALFYSIRALNNFEHSDKNKEEVEERKNHKSINDRMDCLLLLIGQSGPNCMNKHGTSPLHVASELGDLKICKILLENNAKVNIYSEEFGTPLSVAVARGYPDVVDLLLDHGADPNVGHSCQDTKDEKYKKKGEVFPPPLVFASITGQENVVRKLLDRGAEVKLGDHEGWTALHCAAEYGFLDICKLLIEHKADPNIKVNGRNPYYLAITNGHIEVAEYLKEFTEELGLIDVENLRKIGDKQNEEMSREMEEYLSEEEMSEEQVENAKKLVNEGKECGRQMVEIKDYENANNAYTKALSICPRGPSFRELRATLYSNRSLTNLKCKRLKEALDDGNEAVKLAPKWSKAYLRVAYAHREMGETVDYLTNLCQASVLDPENKQLREHFQAEYRKYHLSK